MRSGTRGFSATLTALIDPFWQAQAYSVQGFEAVYRQYRDVVLRFAVQCVGRRDIAEELTADAFLQLHQNWNAIDTERLPAWLLTVVRNRATDYWRRVRLEQRYADEERPSDPPRLGGLFLGLFENPALKGIHRICLTLRYVHEMSVAEIAAYLGLTEVQVKGHLQYARGLLRKQLSPERPHE
ncbi:MAG TPA: sigma-70 family RNA polymerase sigma factor [Bryobacteraceae bacterium]|nr:sigma-70 family RNA polymerase sigma factor [Bryobacteraceae bacterium]